MVCGSNIGRVDLLSVPINVGQVKVTYVTYVGILIVLCRLNKFAEVAIIRVRGAWIPVDSRENRCS